METRSCSWKASCVIQSLCDSKPVKRGNKTGPYAVIIFTFISNFFPPSGSERTESKGIAIKRNVHLKIKAEEKWHQGSTYRWIEASIRVQMEAEDSHSYNRGCIFIYQSLICKTWLNTAYKTGTLGNASFWEGINTWAVYAFTPLSFTITCTDRQTDR